MGLACHNTCILFVVFDTFAHFFQAYCGDTPVLFTILHTSHMNQTNRRMESVNALPHYRSLELLLAVTYFNCGQYEKCAQLTDNIENSQEKMLLLYLKGMLIGCK